MSVTTTLTQNAPVTAENVLRLFPDVNAEPTNGHGAQATQDDDLAGYDAAQIQLMEEVCIVLDPDDQPIGSASKKTCHLMTNISRGLVHRAFSAFVFHPSTHKLLLQQRASAKITFPDMWTNTCCSHPLAVPGETGATLAAAAAGAKRAAQRKLYQELGIPPAQVPPEGFAFLTRIYYMAASDGKWGENEIDYILFTERDVTLEPNPNEVRDTRWVSPDELRGMLADQGLVFTPWFRLICDSMLFTWWERLEQGTGLGEYVGEKEIRRML